MNIMMVQQLQTTAVSEPQLSASCLWGLKSKQIENAFYGLLDGQADISHIKITAYTEKNLTFLELITLRKV